ncbi:zinc-ribbon domain-containing protein [Candidatus Woesearchaeota archaeon]|nr:zinc-ribbon domain-containing protein [Candidatus Woesearchaeota archaeon]
MRKWIEYHPDKSNPNSPLWVNIQSYKEKAVGSSGIKAIVKAAASRAKIKKRVYPHLFRHSRLTELAKRGLNEVQVRIIAGWSKSSFMPEVYVHLSGADVEDKILELEGVKKQESQKERDLLKTISCWRCGEENSAASRFCNKCGAELDEDKRMRDRNKVIEEIKNVDFNDLEQLKEQIIKLFEKGKLSISSSENLTK